MKRSRLVISVRLQVRKNVPLEGTGSVKTLKME